MMMRKNDEIELLVHDLHSDGNGIAAAGLPDKPDVNKKGFAVFVPGALPGEKVRVKILKVKKQYAYGKIIKILEPSPNRLADDDPRMCSVANKCGGCGFQHLDYPAQLIFKEKLVRDALVRIGGFKNPPVLSVLGMDNPYHYRNKAQFPVGENGIGFYAPRSHRIIPITDCNIHMRGDVFRAVCGVLEKYPIPNLRHVVIRTGLEVMIIFVLNGGGLPYAEEIKALLPFNLIINENTAKTNIILGPKFATLQGDDYIHEVIGHIRYRISPRAFFQVNPVQTKVLYDIVAAHLDDMGSPALKVIDAYSGIGGIALYIAGKVQEVVGVESVTEAVEDGNYNAVLNGIKNAGFLKGPAEELVPAMLKREKYDVLILDPPRKGTDDKLLEAAVAAKISEIIYVSCNPATLARDVRQLVKGGYRLVNVQPVDMFPMTGHVEAVVLLSKLKSTESIEVKIDLDEMDLTKSESKATYDEIKQYVLDNTGFKVSQLYIAQVKRKRGITERINYNVGEGKAKVPQVPVDKEKAIEDALRHFQMI